MITALFTAALLLNSSNDPEPLLSLVESEPALFIRTDSSSRNLPPQKHITISRLKDGVTEYYDIWMIICKPEVIEKLGNNPAWAELMEAIRSPTDSIKLGSTTGANPPPVSSKDYIALYIYRIQRQNDLTTYELATLAEAGISIIQLVDEANFSIRSKSTSSKFTGWIADRDDRVRHLPASYIYDKDGGRWPRNSKAAILLSNSTSAPIKLWMKLDKSSYFRYGVDVATSYRLSNADSGKFAALPAVFFAGWDILPFEGREGFLGLHGYVAPDITFKDENLDRITSIAFGGRLDFNGYFSIGLGTNIPIFNNKSDSRGFVMVTVGDELISRLTNR